MKTHNNEGVKQNVNAFARTICVKTPVKCFSGEKSCVDEFGQDFVKSDGDGSTFSTMEANDAFLSKQKKEIYPREQDLSSDHSISRSTVEVGRFSCTIYGCGLCDTIFDVEDEFMGHCHHHYSENPQKSNFEEFFDLHLSSYFS